VLLPVAFPSFDGGVAEAPLLAEHVYQRLDPSSNAPLFPLHPASTLLPIPPLSEAAAGLGHVMVAFDRDGVPRYDYLAVPFDAEFVPSLPVRAAAAYLGLRWSEVGLALGDGIKLGDIFIPTDPAMRLVINYRGPARTIATYSFATLIEGKLDPARFKDRIVLIGASFTGISDTFPGHSAIRRSPAPSVSPPLSKRSCLAMPLARGPPHSRIWNNDTPRCWPGIGRGIGLARARRSTGAAAATSVSKLSTAVTRSAGSMWRPMPRGPIGTASSSQRRNNRGRPPTLARLR
jgi:hypothetical protein